MPQNNLRLEASDILSRDDARKLLAPLAEQCFIPALQAALDRYLSIPAAISKAFDIRTRASAMHDLVVDEAAKLIHLFQGDVELVEDNKLTLFVTDQAAVRVKKVDADGRHRNYPTKQQLEWMYQSTLFTGGHRTLVTFGYQVDDFFRSVPLASFVCWRGRTRVWEIPIVEDIAGYLPVIAAEETQIRQPLVSPKTSALGGKKRG